MLTPQDRLGLDPMGRTERWGEDRGTFSSCRRKPECRPWWRWPAIAVSGFGSGASRRYCQNPKSVGGCRWGARRTVNLVLSAADPTTLYRQRHRGPPTMVWLGAPDQGAIMGSRWVVGPTRVEINLTFSPLISTFFAFTNFITDQYIEHVSSSQLNCR